MEIENEVDLIFVANFVGDKRNASEFRIVVCFSLLESHVEVNKQQRARDNVA